ncbi:C-type lectin domain family 10 member A-like isoform X2 [Heterodontus francisci]|uniref:C-type lectin domain family 10 member A-like isoform X2 n=1 Tax=Heterodontus francisci TaxID=7792 RepID=UPI00355C4DBD
MSQMSMYDNLESFSMANQQGKKNEVKTQDEADPNVEHYRKRNVLLLIFGLLGLCIFLTLLFLLVGLLKISGMYMEMKELQGNLWMELAQFKGNVSEEVERSHSNITSELSNMKIKVSEEVERSHSNITSELSNMKIKGCTCHQCPPNWYQFNQGCYYFSTRKGSWQFATQQCSLKNSHLLVINSILEQNFIKVAANPSMYWIGLSDVAIEGNWQWVDGTNFRSSPTFWADGEPNNMQNGEDCAHIDDKGRWNDNKCSSSYSWICEKKAA